MPSVPGIIWPPLAEARHAALPALIRTLEKTQFLSPSELRKHQHSQLVSLAEYAAKHSPYFAARLQQAKLEPRDFSTPDGLRKLPVMTRRMLQENADELYCRPLPEGHAPVGEVKTSGSSGQPVRMLRTAVNQIFWLAYQMREHLWHGRNFSGKLAVIRANLSSPDPISQPSWGEPASLFTRTGPAFAMPINRPVSEQAQWLAAIDATYLLVYPNNLVALLDEFAAKAIRLPGLRQIRTIGETMPDALRTRVQAELAVPVADSYSSQELGTIASQCPASGLYHIMAESLIVEVLNSKGEPCLPGETGRVVVTDLHNFATPVFRYDLGDYAEVGAPCPCGRRLPTLKRIAGRERNMLRINGERSWPLVGFHRYRDIAPIRQYQLVQKEAELIEVRLVCEPAPTQAQEAQLAAVIRESLGHDFRLNFVYFKDEIPRKASGKFEEFICEILKG